MEKRQSKRVIYNVDAMLVSRSLNFKGKIQNCADDGICIHIHEDQNVCQLLNGMLFEVELTLLSGASIDLRGEVIRTHRQTDNELVNMVGMKIIDGPPEYREFLKTLH